jgi:hypothetical protein
MVIYYFDALEGGTLEAALLWNPKRAKQTKALF